MAKTFQEVPEHWKYPIGPYRQAPEKFGGEWWLVNPFTTDEPWALESRAVLADEPAAGFEEVFGPRPTAAQFSSHRAFQIALVEWKQDLAGFKRSGIPEWTTQRAVDQVTQLFEKWDMGSARFYEGRFGWMARFVDAELAGYEVAAFTAIEASHLVIARYQVDVSIRLGKTPSPRHPFVPADV